MRCRFIASKRLSNTWRTPTLSRLGTTLVSSPLHQAASIASSLTLGSFLVNNYRQALDLLAGQDALQKTMQDQGISGHEVFRQWLVEERAYLSSLAKEPVVETLEMDYYQRLVNFHGSS